MRRLFIACTLFAILASQPAMAQVRGYYRQPALHGNTVVFVSEGDLWKTTAAGGVAQRLTTNLAEESTPQISPDGQTIAFTGRFDNLADVYTIPMQGGVPQRHSWDGISQVVGWTNDGRILYTTSRYSTLPGARLLLVDPKTNAREQVKLEKAWDGSFAGDVLFFTRFGPAALSTRMYTGGTAQKIWKWEGEGEGEAVCLTCDWKGTSRSAQVSGNRVFFLSDRGTDKVMNIWSMDFNGKNLTQHTKHADFEVRDFNIADGRLIYQQGADLHLLQGGNHTVLPITIATDLEQMRDRLVRRPLDFLTDFHIDHKGERISLIARGVAFIAPVDQGRFVQLPNNGGVRYRDMRFAPDGKTIYALNDRSGEVELWSQPADGTGNGTQLTRDADILRWDLEVSPDGRYLAHDDKNQKLYVYDTQSKAQRQVAFSKNGGFSYGWTPDNKLLYIETAVNTNGVIKLYDVAAGKSEQLTTDRFPAFSAVVTPDANWLYFLSNRTFSSSVGSPWGQLQPDPYFNNRTKIYAIRLKGTKRFPFAPKTELDADSVVTYKSGDLHEVPVPAGNYSSLTTDGKRLYFVSRPDVSSGRDSKLNSVEIKNDDVKVETFAEGVSQYELSGDTKKVLFRKGDDFYVVNAGAKAPGDLNESKVDLSGWMLQLERKDELKNLFVDMWRLERDYFYDPGMHGLDWVATRKKYEPLAARVGDRRELNDVVSQMNAELSALHMNVGGGDLRGSADTVTHASLGALLEPVGNGGWRVARIYQTDPDLPGDFGPLLKPGVNVSEGDVIRAINGVPLGQVKHPAELLVGKAGKQTLIELTDGRKAIVYPVSALQEIGLRYADWEYSRKQMVDRLSNGKVGYIHLRAMGTNDINQFARDYYSQFMKEALIIDVRNNGGGNIDSWILAKLMREAWHYWSDRVSDASWNMQYAFRGPMATIVDQNSGSDGEIFPEGFRKLGLGKVFGVRTWGGEIWLTQANVTSDRGIATAPEFGVFADGKWIIEQHGVDPDVVVENYPAATFAGSDAQLEATVRHLLEEVKKNPNPVPTKPAYPKK